MDMKAYHIRTRVEREVLCDPLRFDNFDLDCLFIPEKRRLIGFVKDSKKEGAILSYPPYPAVYSRRIEALINGKNDFNGNPVAGEIKGEISLDSETANNINRNYVGDWLSPFQTYHYQYIKLNKEFDGSTEMLVKTISANISPLSKLRGLLKKLF